MKQLCDSSNLGFKARLISVIIELVLFFLIGE